MKDTDTHDLEQLGYVQELLREMGGFANFAVSFSIISILTGIIQLYGYGLAHGGPLQMSAGWLLVSVGTMFVALSMAELASAYPTAGALYHWASFLGGRRLGWFTACFNTIGQFAVMAGIDYGLAQFFMNVMGWGESRGLAVVIYAAILFSHAFLNHIGVRVVAWLNDFSAWYHIAVVALLVGALLYVGLAQPASFLLVKHSNDGFPYYYSFMVGLLLAQWTLTGYDASAHVSKETRDPRRTAPWGIFLAVAVSVVAGFAMLVVVTLSIPDLNQAVAFGDGAFAEILKLRLGAKGGGALVALILGAMWLCGLSAMTSASRMIYAFARDGGFPYSKIWAKVSPKYRTPVNSIWGMSALAMGLALSVQVYSAVVSTATIALYLSYALAIGARLYAKSKGRDTVRGPWHLGKFSVPVAVLALVWIVFVTSVFVLPPNQQAGYVMIGGLVLFLGIWFARSRVNFKGPKVMFAEWYGTETN